MGKVKNNIGFSEKHIKESEAIKKGLKKVSEKLIAETKATNGYLIFADKDGQPVKVYAKDL